MPYASLGGEFDKQGIIQKREYCISALEIFRQIREFPASKLAGIQQPVFIKINKLCKLKYGKSLK